MGRVRRVRARRSGKVHYWTERSWPSYNPEGGWSVKHGEGLVCWNPGSSIWTSEVDDTDDPVDCKLCLTIQASIDRRPV